MVNMTGPYEIEVEADGKNIDALSCALGVGSVWPEKTCATPKIFKAQWELTSGGKTIAHGSSTDTPGGGTANDMVSRTLGYFQAEKGTKYTLNVKTDSDLSSLSYANPQIIVTTSGPAYETSLVLSGLTKLLAGVLCIVGILILIARRILLGKKLEHTGKR